MKKTVCIALALGATFLLGLVCGDAASRTKPLIVDLGRRMNQARYTEGDYEYTPARSEDGRNVVIVWHK